MSEVSVPTSAVEQQLAMLKAQLAAANAAVDNEVNHVLNDCIEEVIEAVSVQGVKAKRHSYTPKERKKRSGGERRTMDGGGVLVTSAL